MNATVLAPRPNPVRDAAYYQECHELNAAYQENNWLLDELDRIAAFHASSLIELACGNGRFLERAAARFATVHGCDWAVSPLLERVLSERANVSFFRTDLYADLPPCRVDLAVSADFLEHIAPDAIAGVIARIDTLAPKAFHKIACYDDGHSHLSVFEPRVWLDLFHAANPDYRTAGRDEDRPHGPGAFCLIWPPPKPAVVSGHVHVFNMGLMLYNLVRLGVDCRCVELVRCGSCLAIMGTYRRFRVPDLTHNEGDLDALGAFFPFRGYQGFDGDNPPGLVTLDEATER